MQSTYSDTIQPSNDFNTAPHFPMSESEWLSFPDFMGDISQPEFSPFDQFFSFPSPSPDPYMADSSSSSMFDPLFSFLNSDTSDMPYNPLEVESSSTGYPPSVSYQESHTLWQEFDSYDPFPQSIFENPAEYPPNYDDSLPPHPASEPNLVYPSPETTSTSLPSSLPSTANSSPNSKKRKLGSSDDEDEVRVRAQLGYARGVDAKGKTLYRCLVCPSHTSRTHGDITRHLESLAHKPKGHVCPVENCGGSFTRKDALTRHLKVHSKTGKTTKGRAKRARIV